MMLMRTLVALSFSVLALTMPLNQRLDKRGSADSNVILAEGLTDLTADVFGTNDETNNEVLGHDIPADVEADP